MINEINVGLDEELSPEIISLDAINCIVLKINEVMKIFNSRVSMGLFRDNTRQKQTNKQTNKHKRKTKHGVWFTTE